MTFTAAIVGRPNVGKSTLFNRLVGRRLALVDDRPGVTRDRREGKATLGDLAFTVIDTAGFEEAPAGTLPARMRAQTETAIAQADIVLVMVDARSGITPLDRSFATIVRRTGKRAILIANKSEGREREAGALEAFALGLGEPVALSAEHGEGLSDLYDALRQVQADDGESQTDPHASPNTARASMRIAVVGRPNAGKSTLINHLLGTQRLLTGPEAGLTRDAIAVGVTWREQHFQVYDTAGLRRRARVDEKLEKLAVADALRAIRFAEVVVLLLDAQAPFEEQDLRIADLVVREGRALVLGVSKWDLIERRPGALTKLREEADHWLPQVRGVPVVPVSGLTGEGIDRLMQAVIDIHAMWNRRLPTAGLNRWFAQALAAHPPPAVAGRRLKLNYITQPKARPPSFVLFCSRADAVPDAYRRYLVNGLRETFGLTGTPIRLILREKANPYAKKT